MNEHQMDTRTGRERGVMIGSTITHYRIVEKLGEGGMGVVYKAEDLKLRRPVALKTLSAQSQQLRARLLREAEAAACLNHPNICTVYEIDDEHLFLAMEFLDGQTVAEKITEQPLPVEQALDIAVQSAQGLQAAHEKGITHRDVKSSNIMITRSGQVKVMDFGLALTDELTRITQPGVVVGTAAYMSPEQAGGNPVDGRTDIWAMGIVLYEMISGRLPFRGETQAAVVHSILHDQPQPLTAVRSGLPIELDRIVKKALAKTPAERYQHIDEMLVDLKILRSSGEHPRSHQSPTLPPTNSNHRRYLYAGAAALVVVLMVSIWQGKPRVFFPELVPQTAKATIAVLPLANLSAATGEEYFSDGMTDALITELGTIDTLRVISRTSVMRYKGSHEALSQIAAQLNVNHVLEGTVLQDGDRVRVSARLIRMDRDEQQVWTKTYERDLRSILALQREVAHAIASEIGVRFRSESPATAATVDPKAYRAYLLGLQYSNDFPARAGAALDQFERAINLDPKFAPAYAALAQSYGYGGAGRSNSRHEIRRRAVELADKALDLDKNSAEAHNVLGWVKTYFDYDWKGAARAYQRALELNPSLSEGHHNYSHYLMIMGRVDEGLESGRRASELSPFDRVNAGHHVWGLYIARRYDEALKYSRSILDADPENFYARHYAYLVYEQLRDYQRIIGEKPGLVSQTDLARAYALSGSQVDAGRLLKEILHHSDGMNTPFGIALVYLALGDKTSALDWLEQGYQRRVFPLPDISVDARFDPLRSEKRFQELLRRMGLDDRRLGESLGIPLTSAKV